MKAYRVGMTLHDLDDLDGLPAGTVVLDRDLHAAQRERVKGRPEHWWEATGSAGRFTRLHMPVTVIWLPSPPVDEPCPEPRSTT